MKKFIILSVMLALAIVVNAQQLKVSKSFTSVVLVNSQTDYVTFANSINSNNTLAFALTVTGTGSPTVNVTFQEAVESGKWVDVVNAVTLINAGDVATKSYVFKLTDTPSVNYRLKLVQTGTGTSTTTSKLVVKGKI